MAVPPVEPDVEARKRAELAGPGMGTYEELARVLPNGYRALLGPRETQSAIFEVKRHLEERLSAPSAPCWAIVTTTLPPIWSFTS
jgi:hypothetical protein